MLQSWNRKRSNLLNRSAIISPRFALFSSTITYPALTVSTGFEGAEPIVEVREQSRVGVTQPQFIKSRGMARGTVRDYKTCATRLGCPHWMGLCILLLEDCDSMLWGCAYVSWLVEELVAAWHSVSKQSTLIFQVSERGDAIATERNR